MSPTSTQRHASRGRLRAAARIGAAAGLVALLAGAPGAADTLERARSLAAEGRSAEALEALRRHLAESAGDVQANLLEGVLLAELGRTAEAEEIFRRLTRTRPDLPEPFNNLAVLLAAEGRYDDAIEELRRSLQTHPSYHTAYENLSRLYGRMASEAYGQALAGDAPFAGEVDLVLLADVAPNGVDPAVPVRPAPAPPRQTSTRPATPTVPGRAAGAPSPSPVAAPADAGSSEPVTAVHAWAAAWAEQRVDDYLGFYSRRFQPDGESRSDWEARRRRRVAAPRSIKIDLDVRELLWLDTDRVAIRFQQTYESDSYSDVVLKSLELVREDGRWRILAERVES